ncbi:Hypothetical protein H16_A2224 [Cupriavidus necator H16]|uniref:Uncharacterized protein n=2 Tax=Cupriavidus necator TaxID=106590 RepID=Q0K9K0_CUPNH|nr:Hypothetical protein H16_A2224 [Cupriavidus necator H16]
MYFCELSYRYGRDFDAHDEMRRALEERARSGQAMIACADGVHPSVWEQLAKNANREVNA